MNNDHDQSFILEALPAFISEAQEQIQSLEQLLLELEDNPGDRELLNALFRCAHTVKGSAGIFGLDRVVSFTHHVETLLDQLREGKLSLTAPISSLLLKCNDQILLLVEQARDPDLVEDDATVAARNDLVEQLQALSGQEARKTTSAPVAAPTSGIAMPKRWHISVHFGTEIFRNGMDPLAIINYLRNIGEVQQIVCDTELVPPIDQINPESCYLGFEFGLLSEASRADIEGAFSFVRDDCRLTVLNPGASAEEFADLIAAMPDNPRLGDILVAAGAITRAQLERGLRTQASAFESGIRVPLGEVLQRETGVESQVVEAALTKQARQRDGTATATGASPGPNEEQRFIRVQADRLDDVINLLGELVTASAGASLLARQSRQTSLVEANEQISQLVEEIRNGTLQLRMVPIGETFTRFRRVVRDTASDLGKEVQLEIVGGETELDKSMVERIADPLMHLVRNALDHGLEAPNERLAKGKTSQGKLVLSACHESGSVLIRIDDDGRGIQRDKVLARAWERGLVEQGVIPSDTDIDRLIFEPGFSTAEKVTNLSGRGVGMDVVRRNIEALRGTVSLSSTPGSGSRIEIRLPLTLAIIDGFLVCVGNSQFIFPLDAVVEVIENRINDAGVDARGRSLVELRGSTLPVVCLRTLYQIEGERSERSSAVVIRANGQRFGVLVDQLLGQHQTVIKPLGQMLRSLRGVSGSSILANGEVALIFDVNSLCELASGVTGATANA